LYETVNEEFDSQFVDGEVWTTVGVEEKSANNHCTNKFTANASGKVC
jgi:hypothetical protein